MPPGGTRRAAAQTEPPPGPAEAGDAAFLVPRLGKCADWRSVHGLLAACDAHKRERFRATAKRLYDEAAASKSPNGTEPIRDFNFLMNLADYDNPKKYAHVPDDKLPLAIVHEHKRISKDPAINGTCDPMRKW